MGTWGTNLFQDDLSCDVRDEYIDKLRRGKTTIEVEEEILESYEKNLDSDDEYLFWFALAVTEWEYGRLSDKVKEKALYYVKHGNFSVWEDAKDNGYEKWLKTVKEIEEKLLSPQPKEKKVRKYNFYECKWNIGDVFAYQLTSDYSKEKGYEGKYIVFRKIGNTTEYPGHIVPVIVFYKNIWNNCPSINDIINFPLQEIGYFSSILNNKPNYQREYCIRLITTKEKEIPLLIKLGNISEIQNTNVGEIKYVDYLLEFVSWNNTKYIHKIEQYFLEMYESWKEY